MTGLERFMDGIQVLGLTCERRNNLVLVTLDIERPDISGGLLVGADPPNDFPHVPPHWLHAPRQLVLPDGKPNTSELGPDWLKWSRQHPKWKAGVHGVKHWLAHARSLILAATIK